MDLISELGTMLAKLTTEAHCDETLAIWIESTS
jgi:hypothetical protein